MTSSRAPYEPEGARAALTRAGAGRVEVLDEVPSTSTALVRAATADPGAWPDLSVVLAHHQSSGRGRAGRSWQTPAGAALTISVLLRPDVPADRLGWVPLLTGLAVTRAVRDVAGVPATLKWPNDVLVTDPGSRDALPGWGDRRKVAGVLAEVVPGPGTGGGPHAVVVGVGVNLTQTRQELPVPGATSLHLVAGAAGAVGPDLDRTAVAAALVSRLVELDRRWRGASGADDALHEECTAACSTLGGRVRVERPGGGGLVGTATALGPDGQLVVVDDDGREHHVLAGDVHHVRPDQVN
ncbi:biotin--[acetyl-CoA-carboxylase] ligase [Cellulomonas bogoriensis]|uniref:biotin--[biotin carboxyl-carrier protein] ligase n=1 Tax=Cellulomonas bogoriensis 69B4 = DSM 16987 TaxID=1386082 RepID=A0A0A0BMJ1_9CELL|nr:biotin--[acetyl-CoA-carboxylase] ligase [Cellulomonas bogoriensis]KGM08932.1 biotin--acetyl-CoA-carboxylase ligase [Cellulomonas bogoriensis 69B4 = DSM 16987]